MADSDFKIGITFPDFCWLLWCVEADVQVKKENSNTALTEVPVL